jgi:hypothetical protein
MACVMEEGAGIDVQQLVEERQKRPDGRWIPQGPDAVHDPVDLQGELATLAERRVRHHRPQLPDELVESRSVDGRQSST